MTVTAAPTFFKDVRVFDGEQTHPRSSVLVQDGQVAAVGSDLTAPPGAAVVTGDDHAISAARLVLRTCWPRCLSMLRANGAAVAARSRRTRRAPYAACGRCEAQPIRSASETMIPSGPRT
jgi:hypothetical protein